MTSKTEMVSVPRELLLRLLSVYSASPYPAWHELAAALEAAPAEDVRAVGDEPVACYVATDDLEAIQSGSKMWATAWATDSAMNPSGSFSQPLYSRPQRPVVLRTQGRLVVFPERRQLSTTGRVYLSDLDCEWNACIDEFERLNK